MASRSAILAVFVFFFFCAAQSSVAQTSFSLTTSPLLMSISPANPEPGAFIQASVTILSLDLSELQILWYVNDKLVKGYVGATNVQVHLSSSGATHIAALVI